MMEGQATVPQTTKNKKRGGRKKNKKKSPSPEPRFHDKFNLLQLLHKANHYVQSKGSQFRHSPWFYRDKSPHYFQNILSNYLGVMETYSKDYHGDPRSPINGRLNGLFFSVNVDLKTNLPPIHSIYGEMRLSVPAQCLLSQHHNLYFTDFYCISRSVHYVTLVMTRPGSPTDIFCSRHLVRLDWYKNAFLRLFYVPGVGGCTPTLFVTTGLWVEVLYTEDLVIPHLFIGGAKFEKTIMKGIRSGGRIGHPKNAQCQLCNL